MGRSIQIQRLREALQNLRSFRERGVNAYDAEFAAWKNRTHRVLHDLFGPSQYLREFSSLHFCEPRVHVAVSASSKPQWLPMDQRRFDGDLVAAERLITDAIEDAEEPPVNAGTKPTDSFEMSVVWPLLHPDIVAASKTRFEAAQYADAAEAAFKAVNSRVKSVWKAAGEEEKDGKALMLSAFSPNQPTIRFDDLSTDSGKSIQEGYMHIFAGSIQAIRNPKAHELVTISPERAAHFLVLASLLMCKLDDAGA